MRTEHRWIKHHWHTDQTENDAGYPKVGLYYKGAEVALFENEYDAEEACLALNEHSRLLECERLLKKLHEVWDAEGRYVGQEVLEVQVCKALKL